MPSRILRLWNPNVAAWEEVGDSRLTVHLAAADPHPQYLTAAEGGGAYLPLTGGTLTGAVILQGAAAGTNVLQAKLAADTQPRFRADAAGRLEWGPGGSTAPNLVLNPAPGSNALNVTGNLLPTTDNTGQVGAPGLRAWQAMATHMLEITDDTGSIRVGLTGVASTGMVRLKNAAAVAWRNAANGADLTMGWGAADRLSFKWGATEKVAATSTGTLTLTPDAGQPALSWSGGRGTLAVSTASPTNPVLRATDFLLLDPASNYVLPERANAINVGSGALPFLAFYAQNGTIQPSSRDVKEEITPLDPAAAMAAVRNTEPVTFTYLAPERPPEWYDLPDDPEQAEQVLLQRLTAAPLEAAARHQAGFVAEQADPLFLTGEGQTNPANSVGVLLAALHDIDVRLTALEEPAP